MGYVVGRLIAVGILLLALLGGGVLVKGAIGHFTPGQAPKRPYVSALPPNTIPPTRPLSVSPTPTMIPPTRPPSVSSTPTGLSVDSVSATLISGLSHPTPTRAPTPTPPFPGLLHPTVPGALTADEVYRWCYGWPNCERGRIQQGDWDVIIRPGPIMKFTVPKGVRINTNPCEGLRDAIYDTHQETTLQMCSGMLWWANK